MSSSVPPPASADNRARWTLGLLALLFVLACAPMLAAPILPTIDYYDHMSRYFVLSHLSGDSFLDQNYEAAWSLLPNIGLDVVGTLLMRHVDVLAGAKLIALTIFAVQYFGVQLFNRMLTGRFSLLVGVLSVPLLYSFIFTWGFANFLLGLGLVFWGAAVWLATRSRPILTTALGCVFALAIFLTHGVAFGLYGLLLGGLEIGFFIARRTSIASFAGRLVMLAAQAVTPMSLFIRSATVTRSDGVTNAGSSIKRLAEAGRLPDRMIELVFYRLQTILRVAEGPALWFDVVTLAVVAGLLLWLARKRAVTIPNVVWPALALGALMVVVMPPALFGVGYVADRMPLFFALLFVGSLSFARSAGAELRLAGVVLALLVAARLTWIGIDWQSYRADLQAADAIAARMPPQQVVGYVNVTLHPRRSDRRRCEMYGPLLVSRHGDAAPLFAIPTAQPMNLKGRLLSALADLPDPTAVSGAAAVASRRDRLSEIIQQRRFDYVLICDADRLGSAQPWRNAVAAQAGRFTLLRIR